MPAAEPPPAKPADGAIRIRAGFFTPHTDEEGVEWQKDQGFEEGDVMDRPHLKIGNTRTPSIYQSERFGMTKFTQKVPNGNYTVKLHFAITYEAIGQAGQVVFSFNVAGTEFKDFDIWEKAGGAQRAYVEVVPVKVTNGKIEITFTAQLENPTISAIEIIPKA